LTLEKADGRVLLRQITAKERSDDYMQIVSSVEEVEQAVEQHAKVRMLVTLQDFRGW